MTRFLWLIVIGQTVYILSMHFFISDYAKRLKVRIAKRLRKASDGLASSAGVVIEEQTVAGEDLVQHKSYSPRQTATNCDISSKAENSASDDNTFDPQDEDCSTMAVEWIEDSIEELPEYDSVEELGVDEDCSFDNGTFQMNDFKVISKFISNETDNHLPLSMLNTLKRFTLCDDIIADIARQKPDFEARIDRLLKTTSVESSNQQDADVEGFVLEDYICRR